MYPWLGSQCRFVSIFVPETSPNTDSIANQISEAGNESAITWLYIMRLGYCKVIMALLDHKFIPMYGCT